MRSRSEALSRAIVRLHPRAWRERYDEEVFALIEDSGSTWAHTIDLAFGCANEWLRAALRLPYFWGWLRFVDARWLFVLADLVRGKWLSLTPPTPMQVALQGAFWILVLFLN